MPTLTARMRNASVRPVVQVPQNHLAIVPRAFPVSVGTFGLGTCVGLAVVYPHHVVVAHFDTTAATATTIEQEVGAIITRLGNLTDALGAPTRAVVFTGAFTGFGVLNLTVNALNASTVLAAALEKRFVALAGNLYRSAFRAFVVNAESGAIHNCDDEHVENAPQRTFLQVGQAHGGAFLHVARQ